MHVHTHLHTHTHNCSLHPHTSPQITFHSNTRNKVPLAKESCRGRGRERKDREGEKNRRETEGERERLSIGWSWLNLGLNFITNAEQRSRKLSDTPLKERTEECSHSILPLHLSFIFISLSTPGRAFLKNSFSLFLFSCLALTSFTFSLCFSLLSCFSQHLSLPSIPATGLLAFSLYI